MGCVCVAVPSLIGKTWKVWFISQDGVSLFNPDCTGLGGFVEAVIMRASIPIGLLVLVLFTFGANRVTSAVLRKPQVAMDRDRFVNIFFSIVFTFFLSLASMSLVLF